MLSMAPPPPPIRPPLSSGCNPEAEEGERIALYFLGGWEGGGVNKPEEGTASASPNKSRMLEAAPATLAGLPASDAPPFAKNSAKFVGGLSSISIKRTLFKLLLPLGVLLIGRRVNKYPQAAIIHSVLEQS